MVQSDRDVIRSVMGEHPNAGKTPAERTVDRFLRRLLQAGGTEITAEEAAVQLGQLGRRALALKIELTYKKANSSIIHK